MPKIEQKLKERVQQVFNKAINNFKKVMEQFIKENNMRACEISGEISIDFTPSMPFVIFRRIIMVTVVGTLIWLAAAASSWSREATLE